MLTPSYPAGLTPSGQPIYPPPTVVYSQKGHNPSYPWCPDFSFSQVYTSGQSWQLYHLPCFPANHPPTQQEIFKVMEEIGCGGGVMWHKNAYCNFTPTGEEIQTQKLYDGVLSLGILGGAYFLGEILGIVILLAIVLKIFGIFIRRAAEIRKDVYKGRLRKRRNPFTWGFKILVILLILCGIGMYVSSGG